MISKKVSLKKGCIIFITAYFVIAGIFYLIAGPQLKYKDSEHGITSVEAMSPIGTITEGNTVVQGFRPNFDSVSSISLMFATYSRINNGSILIQLADHNSGQVLSQVQLDTAVLEDNKFLTVPFEYPIDLTGNEVVDIIVSSETKDDNNAVTLWYNQSIETQSLTVGGIPVNGTLCFSAEGKDIIAFGEYYWLFIVALGIAISIYFVILIQKAKKRKPSFGLKIISAFTRYRFLLEQLVSRDFKTKYKRSVLGVLWSFLNPLLSMIVQYIVFVNLFRFQIENYAVYLLSGIVFFNFFAEAANQAMGSIVNNAPLITKVYVPKYIYPVSKVFSSTVNLLLSILPLILVMAVTGSKFSSSILLLPFGIVCMIIFSIGVGFILSSLMVFFRDTEFLWGVFIMMWMYLTPIFYPETILPPWLLLLIKFNPLYHFIRFNRIILLQGVSPEPRAYFICAVFALGMLLIGSIVFKKTQDKFVINI